MVSLLTLTPFASIAAPQTSADTLKAVEADPMRNMGSVSVLGDRPLLFVVRRQASAVSLLSVSSHTPHAAVWLLELVSDRQALLNLELPSLLESP